MKNSVRILVAFAAALIMASVTVIAGTTPASATSTCSGPTEPRSVLGVPFNQVIDMNMSNSGQIYSGPSFGQPYDYQSVRAGTAQMQAYTSVGLPYAIPYFSVGQAYAYDDYDLGDIYQVWQSNLEFDTSSVQEGRIITNTYIELDYAYDWSPSAFYIEARPTSYVAQGASAWVPGASITTSAPAAFTRFGYSTGCNVKLIGDLTNYIDEDGVTQFNLTPADFAANVAPDFNDGVLGFTGARLVVEYSVSDFFP